MKQSRLLVTSPSNIKLAKQLFNIENYKVMIVDHPPPTVRQPVFKGLVMALGGGSVIDTAKLVAGSSPCHACPTTASGAALTSHACVWTKTKKIDVKTPKPIPLSLNFPIKLSPQTIKRTAVDCYCHIIESFTSRKATEASRNYCRLALLNLKNFYATKNTKFLIRAGNWAGMAIEIAPTNIIHAVSYVFTLDYGMCHGDALVSALNIFSHKKFNKIMAKAQKLYPSKFQQSELV